MKTFIRLVLIAFLFGSCTRHHGNGIKVKIENNSDEQIKYIKVYTSERLDSLNYNVIQAKKLAEEFLNMSQNKTDGGYIIEFTTAKGLKKHINAGYYTNGGPLETHMKIEIENDTTLVSFSGIPL